MTTSLTDFLLARVSEDEDEAKHQQRYLGPYEVGGWENQHTTRVLAECEARRRIVEICQWWAPGLDHARITASVLTALAAVYADHPDFDPEWGLG